MCNHNIKSYQITVRTIAGPPFLKDFTDFFYHHFYLFRKIKKWPGGQTFSSNEEVIDETEA